MKCKASVISRPSRNECKPACRREISCGGAEATEEFDGMKVPVPARGERRRRGRQTDLQKLNALTERIIGCAIAVHKHPGPGLLASIDENAWCLEFAVARKAW
jgi:hypothetical protein